MPGGKISCNSFYMFLMELKRQEEMRGRRCSLADIEPEASRRWVTLTAEQKSVYKVKAREYKSSQEFLNKKREARSRPHRSRGRTKGNRVNGYIDDSSSDESYDDAFIYYDPEDEDKFMRRRNECRTAFRTTLTWNLGSDIINKISEEMFFVASVQNYYETQSHEHMPAEIAVVGFSLKHGIQLQYSTILKPIRMPDYCRNSAAAKANQTHKISASTLSDDYRDDYRNIVNEIKSFTICKQQNQFRALVLFKQYNSVQGAAKTLRLKTGSQSFLPADRIMCIEDFYQLLCNLKGIEPRSNEFGSFNRVLTETEYDYEPNTLCEFHNRCQSKHCALGTARKICYHLFDLVNHVFSIPITFHHKPRLPNGISYNRSNLSAQLSEHEETTEIDNRVNFGNIEFFRQNSLQPVDAASIRLPFEASNVQVGGSSVFNDPPVVPAPFSASMMNNLDSSMSRCVSPRPTMSAALLKCPGAQSPPSPEAPPPPALYRGRALFSAPGPVSTAVDVSVDDNRGPCSSMQLFQQSCSSHVINSADVRLPLAASNSMSIVNQQLINFRSPLEPQRSVAIYNQQMLHYSVGFWDRNFAT